MNYSADIRTKKTINNSIIKNLIFKLISITFLLFAPIFFTSVNAASLVFTINQGDTGGTVGALNTLGDDFCPTASTPGCDFSGADNIVRTNDDVLFQFNASVGPLGDNPVIITAELDPGLWWPTLPTNCDQISSSITGDGTPGNPSILICDLGQKAAWSSTFNVAARALGSNPNGATAGMASASMDAPNSTRIDILTFPPDVTITASPRMNLRKQFHNSVPVTIGGVTYLRLLYKWWIDTWKHDTNGNPNDDPDPMLGNEMVVGPITFTEDPSNVSPNAYIDACWTPTSTLFPYPTYNTTYPERSVLKAGSSSCANTGPTATGPTTVTVTGADLSLSHTPTQRNGGAAIPSDRNIASFGFIRLLVPTQDIVDAGGSIGSVNTLTNFDPVSISNISNMNEDLADNTATRNLVAGKGSWSKLYRHSMIGENDPGRSWWNYPTNATGNWAGDGNVLPGETFATSTAFNNNTFGPVNEVEICDVIDANLYEFADRNNAPGVAHLVYGSGMAAGGEGTGYIVEYGINYVGTWPPTTFPNPAALNTECEDASVQWFPTLTAARAAGLPTKVRYRRLTPQPLGSGALVIKHRVRSDITAPNGTLLINMATQRTSLSNMVWRSCNYRSGGDANSAQVGNSCGDRLILSRSKARITKTTVPNDAVTTVQAGGTVTYKLEPNFTSPVAINDIVTVSDKLPPGIDYVNNSATWNGVATPPVITGTLATGLTLTWNLGTQTTNTPIPPIEFTAKIPINSTDGTLIDNVASIKAVTDISSEAQRSDTRRVVVTSPASLLIAKTTTTPLEQENTPLKFEVEYFNGTAVAIPNSDVIDILPFNGDNRFPPSNFSGTYTVSPITYNSASATPYYTNKAPATINNDPQDSSNNIPTGTTKWCTSIQFGTVGCPSGFNDITAVRLVDMEPLPANTVRTISIGITPTGNFGTETYTNLAQAYGEGVILSAFSPFATARIIEEPSIGLAKALSAQNGNNLTFTFVLENLGNIDLKQVTLIDNLDSVFGTGNYVISNPPVIINQPANGNLTLNAAFTGSGSNINLLDPAGVNDLPIASKAEIVFSIDVLTLSDQGQGVGIYSNSASSEGTTESGNTTLDNSDDGITPDPNNDGDATGANENDLYL